MGSSRRKRIIQPDVNYNGINNNNISEQPNFNMQPNMNNIGQLLNNIDLNQVMSQLSQMLGSPSGVETGPAPRPNAPMDTRLQLLQAMKPFVNARRGDMLDKIGQIYSIVKMLQRKK